MAATTARSGFGTQIKVYDAADLNPVAILEVRNITALPSLETEDLDAFHMESPSGIREFIAGPKNPGNLEFEVNWNPTNATQNASVNGIRGLQVSGSVRKIDVALPASQNQAAITFTFRGYVKNFSPALAADDVAKATVSIKMSGEMTEL